MSSKSGTRSIGHVLGLLKNEFPDISISKIRFLETEGLISPQRAPSGYRRYTDADVERLRYVLSVQRSHYLPLKVIREHLEAIDRRPPARGVRNRWATSTRVQDFRGPGSWARRASDRAARAPGRWQQGRVGGGHPAGDQLSRRAPSYRHGALTGADLGLAHCSGDRGAER